MAINGISINTGINVSVTKESYSVKIQNSKTEEKAEILVEKEAVSFEKSESTTETKKPKVDFETIDRLKAEAEKRHAQLKGIVEKLLLKQGGTILNSEGLASVYRKLDVDPEISEQAKKDIAEDGYWGVEQTSDRIISFAKALAGEDAEIAGNMLDAIKKGFEDAETAWGEKLPDISQETMKVTIEKAEEWIKSLT